MAQSEAQLQMQVADYLRLQYPDVMFHSDFGSGVKLTPRQAAIQKRQSGGQRGWPDMFIAESRIIGSIFKNYSVAEWLGRTPKCTDKIEGFFSGLFLELKKEGTRLKKKTGEWATEHIAEQAEMLEKLRGRGYVAEFAIGFDQAKRIIDEYLGGRNG